MKIDFYKCTIIAVPIALILMILLTAINIEQTERKERTTVETKSGVEVKVASDGEPPTAEKIIYISQNSETVGNVETAEEPSEAEQEITEETTEEEKESGSIEEQVTESEKESVALNGEAETEAEAKLNAWQKVLKEASVEDMKLLRKVMYCECHDEDFTGRVAAYEVVLNRVLSPEWPETITEVLEQDNGKQFNGLWYIKTAEPGEREDDVISYIADGGEMPLDRRHVYFDTGKKNGRQHVKIGNHYFGIGNWNGDL